MLLSKTPNTKRIVSFCAIFAFVAASAGAQGGQFDGTYDPSNWYTLGV